MYRRINLFYYVDYQNYFNNDTNKKTIHIWLREWTFYIVESMDFVGDDTFADIGIFSITSIGISVVFDLPAMASITLKTKLRNRSKACQLYNKLE